MPGSSSRRTTLCSRNRRRPSAERHRSGANAPRITVQLDIAGMILVPEAPGSTPDRDTVPLAHRVVRPALWITSTAWATGAPRRWSTPRWTCRPRAHRRCSGDAPARPLTPGYRASGASLHRRWRRAGRVHPHGDQPLTIAGCACAAESLRAPGITLTLRTPCSSRATPTNARAAGEGSAAGRCGRRR